MWNIPFQVMSNNTESKCRNEVGPHKGYMRILFSVWISCRSISIKLVSFALWHSIRIISSISQFRGKGYNSEVAEHVYYLTEKGKTGDAIPLTLKRTRQAQNIDEEYTATGYLYPTIKLLQSVQNKKVIAHKMFNHVIILLFLGRLTVMDI